MKVGWGVTTHLAGWRNAFSSSKVDELRITIPAGKEFEAIELPDPDDPDFTVERLFVIRRREQLKRDS